MDKPYLNETPVNIELSKLSDDITDLIFDVSGEYDYEEITKDGRISLEPLEAI